MLLLLPLKRKISSKIAYSLLILLSALSNAVAQEYLQLNYNCESADLPFSNVAVIDNRVDNQLLGYIQKGALNRTEQIQFRGNLIDSLSQFFRTKSPKVNEQKTLVFVLNELFMNELTKEFSERGRLKLSLRLFSENSENRFSELLSIDSVYSVRGMDVTKKLLRSVSDQFCAIAQNLPAVNTDIQQQPDYSFEELHHLDSLETLTIPIYSADKPKAGIYKDYAHFKMNAPDIAADIVIEESRKEIRIFRLYGAKKKKIELENDGIYAVSDGERLVKATSGGYFEIKKEGFQLYYDRPGSYSESNNAAVIGGAAFGLIGAIVASGISPDKSNLYRFRINHRKGNSVPIALVRE